MALLETCFCCSLAIAAGFIAVYLLVRLITIIERALLPTRLIATFVIALEPLLDLLNHLFRHLSALMYQEPEKMICLEGNSKEITRDNNGT